MEQFGYKWTQLARVGQWVTKKEAMSYGDAYLCLKPDDTQGMATQWKAMLAFYTGKK